MASPRTTPAFSITGKPLPTPADPCNGAPSLSDADIEAAIHAINASDDPFATPLPENISVQRDIPLGREGKDYFAARDGDDRIVAYADPAPPPTYTDLMIDVEALADTPDSAPAEIALVFFDRDDPTKAFCKYRYEPSPISSMRLGMIVTTSTLLWWDDQGMTIAPQQGEPVTEVLDEIAADIARHGRKDLRIWSRGNAYDIAILELLYQRAGKKLPFPFHQARDVRTWLEGCQFKSPRKANHCALDDAVNQALDVIEATAAIPAVSLN